MPKAPHFSPALQAFELNPFRILRVAATVTTAEAAFEAEKVLTLARAEMASDTPDLLPWLPTPGLPEIQHAAQTIEEPLLRLKHQLLWFDLGSTHDSALETAVRSRDEAAINACLRMPPPRLDPATASAPLPATHTQGDVHGPVEDNQNPAAAPSGEKDANAGSSAADQVAIAFAINQANLRLLLAACRINGLWPITPPSLQAAEPLPEKDWKPLGGNARWMRQAHSAVADSPSGRTDEIRVLWRDGLARWTALLADPRFRDFVVSRIEAIHDDLVQADDAEAVEESIRAHLADLSAQEIRFLLIDNRYGLTGALVSGLAESRLEPRVLTSAMRPVRQFLQTELATLDLVLEQAEGDKSEPIARYLRRLVIVRDRWLALDRNAILGLGDLIDQAAERAYLKLRQWEKPTAQTDGLLEQAAGIASAQSLRERIATLRSQHNERRELVCAFCHENDPDYDKSVVLKGKKETGRSRSGNTTTVHYSIWHRVVMRCGRCASLHDFERKVAISVTACALLAVVIIGFLGFEAYEVSQESPYRYSSYSGSSGGYSGSGGSSSSGSGSSSSGSYGASGGGSPSPIPSPRVGNSWDMETTRPMANDTSNLSMAELRWCLVAQIQIHAQRQEMDRLKQIYTDRFNRNVDKYNNKLHDFVARCTNRSYNKYYDGLVTPGVEARRSQIEADARAEIQ